MNKVRLKSDVQVLDAAALIRVQTFEVSSGVLTASSSLSVKPGAVLVAGLSTATPLGLLRRVKTVTTMGDVLRVETEQASLADVVAEGTITIDHPLTGDDLVDVVPQVDGLAPLTRNQKTYPTPGGVVLGLNNVLLKDLDGNDATKDDQVRLTASFTVEPRVKFAFDFSLTSGLKEASVTLGLKDALTYRLTGGAGLNVTTNDIPLAKLVYAPIVIDVGFPLVFVPTVDLVVGATANLSVKFVSEAVAQVEGDIGVGYVDGDFQTIHTFTSSSTTTTANVGGSLFAEAHAGPNFALLVYGVAGPKLGLKGYGRFQADLTKTPCWDFSVGASVTAGLDLGAISILGLGLGNHDFPLYDENKSLLSGACDPSVAGLNPNGVTFGRALSAPKALDFRDATGLPDGSIVSVSNDPDGAWLTRMRPDGTADFQRHIDGVFGAARVAVSADGRLFVAGKHGGLQPWLAKFDLDGNLIWSQLYDFSAANVAGLVATPDGGAILAGTYLLASGASYGEFLLRVSPTGAVLWANGYDVGFEAKELRRTGDTLALVGWTSYQGSGAGHLTRLDFDGNVVWNRRASGALQYLNSVDVDGPTGTLATVGMGIDGAAYLTVSPAGDLLGSGLVYVRSQRSLELRFDSVRHAPGGFVAVGARDFGAAADALAVQFGENGNPVWAQTYGTAAEDTFNALVVNLAPSGPNAGLWPLGTTYSVGSAKSQFLVRTSATGEVDLANGASRVTFNGNIDKPGTELAPGDVLPSLVFAPVAVKKTALTVSLVAASEQPVPVPAELAVKKLSAQ